MGAFHHMLEGVSTLRYLLELLCLFVCVLVCLLLADQSYLCFRGTVVGLWHGLSKNLKKCFLYVLGHYQLCSGNY